MSCNVSFNTTIRKLSSVVYPTYITNAPLTEVSKTSNGVRVATEVSVIHICTLNLRIFN